LESVLTALGAWYEAQPPSAAPRIKLATTAEGWELRIGLLDTDAEGRGFVRVDEHRGTADWLTAWRTDEAWHAACGPRDLDDAIDLFLGWFNAAPEPDLVGPLGADLEARLAELGVDADLAAPYGPDKVRWALDTLDAAHVRSPMVAPGAWVERLHEQKVRALVGRHLPAVGIADGDVFDMLVLGESDRRLNTGSAVDTDDLILAV